MSPEFNNAGSNDAEGNVPQPNILQPNRPNAHGEPSPEVLVLGGGLAGPAAAICLARAGRRVTLVEREHEAKNKVCGEFLSAEALGLIQNLGIDVSALGALPITGVRLCDGRRTAGTPLPFPAMSLSRRCLDAALLSAAANAGAHVLQGVSVDALVRDNGVWRARLSDGRALAAPDVILATGKHDLRGFPRPPGPQNDLVALKMYLCLQPEQAAALERNVELLLYPGGYAGLQTVGAEANLCCLVKRRNLNQLGGWAGLLREIAASSPHARRRLEGAEPLLPKPLAAASIPYGFVRRYAPGEHLWAVGDQAAVIPSFTGDGMSIALYTGLRAAGGLLANESSENFQTTLHRALHGQVARATVVSRALLRPSSRSLLTALAHLCPSLMRSAALWTRLPTEAMHNIGSI